MRRLVISSKRNPFKTATQLQRECNLAEIVSVDTVKRRLRENNLFGRVSARKPHLTQNQRIDRKRWCFAPRNWNSTDFEKIIFFQRNKN